jgi:hypothetical protein
VYFFAHDRWSSNLRPPPRVSLPYHYTRHSYASISCFHSSHSVNCFLRFKCIHFESFSIQCHLENLNSKFERFEPSFFSTILFQIKKVVNYNFYFECWSVWGCLKIWTYFSLTKVIWIRKLLSTKLYKFWRSTTFIWMICSADIVLVAFFTNLYTSIPLTVY